MKYSIVKVDISPLKLVDENTEKVTVTIGIHPEDGFAKDFSEDVEVLLDDSMTIGDAKIKCSKAVSDFMDSANA